MVGGYEDKLIGSFAKTNQLPISYFVLKNKRNLRPNSAFLFSYFAGFSQLSRFISATKNNILLASQKSNVIYKFLCYCDNGYCSCKQALNVCKAEQNNRFRYGSSYKNVQTYFLPAGANLPSCQILNCFLLIS